MREVLEIHKGDTPQRYMLSVQHRVGIFNSKFNHSQREERGKKLLIFNPNSIRIDIANHTTDITTYLGSVINEQEQLIICFFEEDVTTEKYQEFWNAFSITSRQHENFCIVFCGNEESIPVNQYSNVIELQFAANSRR